MTVVDSTRKSLTQFLDASKKQSEPASNATSSDDQWLQGVVTAAPTGGRVSISFDGGVTSTSCKYTTLYTPANGDVVWALKVGNNAPMVVFSTSAAAAGAVTSFNARTGAVTLTSSDVTSALGYTPLNKAADTMTGRLTLASDLYMTAGSASGRVLYQDTVALYVGAIDQARNLRLRANGTDVVVATGSKFESIVTHQFDQALTDGSGRTIRDVNGGWSRTYGATGWYNNDYGGGWYMSDATWIRSYGSKQVYIDSVLRVDTRLEGSSGGAPVLVSPTAQSPTFQNGWTNYGAPFGNIRYWKDAQGFVYLDGMMKSGTLGATAFNLPAGYRPANQELFVVNTAAGPTRIDILTSGDVGTSGSNTWISLCGVTFPTF